MNRTMARLYTVCLLVMFILWNTVSTNIFDHLFLENVKITECVGQHCNHNY